MTLVLHLDDELPIRLLVRVNLENQGFEVAEVSDGNSALEAARALQPDVMLLDVMHAPPDGYEVARILASDERTRDIPLIFLTARSRPQDQRRGLELGAVGYVMKPFNPLELAPLIREVLARVARGEREQLIRERLTDVEEERAED